MRFALIALSTFLLAQTPAAFASTQQDVFSSEQKALVKEVVDDFRVAMGAVAVSPENNCPGTREYLRAKIVELQPLIEIATSQPTETFLDSGPVKDVLDTELALAYVDKTCAASGV